MLNPDSDTEQVLNETLNELERQNYRRDRLSQGLFVTALDLKEYAKAHPDLDATWLDDAIGRALSEQDQWVMTKLENNQLPTGFAKSAVDGDHGLVEFDSDEVDHEWLMYPGDSLFEVFVRGYHPVICGEWSVQAATEKLRDETSKARELAFVIMGQLGTGSVSIAPFIAVLAFYIVEEGVEHICAEYEPY